MAHSDQVAIYGVSGGGYFTTLAAQSDPRIKAWVAATPIFDIGKTFKREFGPALKTPGWLLNFLMRLAGSVNKSAEINLNKYAWMFGTKDFKSAVKFVLNEAIIVDYTKISIPSLFLMSEGEAPELKRQTLKFIIIFNNAAWNVTLREFLVLEGADGHCQINNLRLAYQVIFDWLDRVFNHDSGDIRLRC